MTASWIPQPDDWVIITADWLDRKKPVVKGKQAVVEKVFETVGELDTIPGQRVLVLRFGMIDAPNMFREYFAVARQPYLFMEPHASNYVDFDKKEGAAV